MAYVGPWATMGTMPTDPVPLGKSVSNGPVIDTATQLIYRGLDYVAPGAGFLSQGLIGNGENTSPQDRAKADSYLSYLRTGQGSGPSPGSVIGNPKTAAIVITSPGVSETQSNMAAAESAQKKTIGLILAVGALALSFWS